MKYYDLSQKRPSEIKEYLCKLNHNGRILYRVMWWTGCFVTAPGYTVTNWGEIPTVGQCDSLKDNDLFTSLLLVKVLGSMAAVGESIFLSANTVRYRISKLESIHQTKLIKGHGRGGAKLTKRGEELLSQWQAENDTHRQR